MGDSMVEIPAEKARWMRDRIRDLEAEVYVVREASDNWRECAEDWRKRAEKAEAENARLREAGDVLAGALESLDGFDEHVDAQDAWHAAKRGTYG